MKRKGLVLQIQDNQAYIMSKEGTFHKIPVPRSIELGQEIEWLESETIRNKKLFKKIWMPVSGVAIACVLFLGLWHGQVDPTLDTQKAFAYVSIDINPSIELSVDEKEKVLHSTADNSDGQNILHKVSLQSLTIHQAVQSITQQANKQGFIKSDGDIFITTSPASDHPSTRTIESINNLETNLENEVKQLM